jgi:hypothetical protein
MQEEVRQREPLEERVVQHLLTTDVDGVLRIPRAAAERVIGHGEIDLRPVRLEDLRRQMRRRRARDAQLVLTEQARVLVEQPKRAVAGRRDVAVPVGEQEEPVVFQSDRARRRGFAVAGHLLVSDRGGHGDDFGVPRTLADRLAHADTALPRLVRIAGSRRGGHVRRSSRWHRSRASPPARRAAARWCARAHTAARAAPPCGRG